MRRKKMCRVWGTWELNENAQQKGSTLNEEKNEKRNEPNQALIYSRTEKSNCEGCVGEKEREKREKKQNIEEKEKKITQGMS
jgi:hypothetical protein